MTSPARQGLRRRNLAAALKELKASAHDIIMLRVYVVNADAEISAGRRPLRRNWSVTQCPALRRSAFRLCICWR